MKYNNLLYSPCAVACSDIFSSVFNLFLLFCSKYRLFEFEKCHVPSRELAIHFKTSELIVHESHVKISRVDVALI